jgi:hypothetical protein
MTAQVFVPLVLGLVLSVYVAIAITTWRRFRGAHVAHCPQSNTLALVTVDIGRAITTAVWDSADVRVASCSRWPEREGCGQLCVSQIAASPALTRVQRARSDSAPPRP